jgi:hypothetical protein
LSEAIVISKPSHGVPTVVAMSSNESPCRDAVIVPASVSPYPVMIEAKGSSSRIRLISSTGMSAAPVTATRRDDMSCPPRACAASSS